MWRLRTILPFGALTVAAATYAIPSVADACGGTFCDGGSPTNMPVDQTGETILFAIDNGYVEAHIQIEYDGGDAEQFAWIVPVPEIPEIEVGSWRLVQTALAGTVPVYGYQDSFNCSDSSGPPGGGGVGFIEDPDGGGVGGRGPTVVAEDIVGAFQYAILQGGTAESVTMWLIDNGYQVEEEAPDILDTYIGEGHVFVAFRLRHGQGVEDIHPVVVRYPGDEPCIPIRLTRIAAKEDMDIRALFLGEDRVVSTNFREVLLNRTRLDWVGLGANYKELVTLAVDEPMANGRAWVTEYAGPSSVIDPGILDSSNLDASVFETIAAVDVIAQLEAQGVLDCSIEGCNWFHELASSLVHEFLPVPKGVDEGEFYACLSCYAGLIDPAAWDPALFAAAYQERIIDPLLHAEDLLATWPYVTRLYTTISPLEMTEDPLFAEHPGLEDVPNRYGAQREQECCGMGMTLPGGRFLWLDGNGQWPQWDDEMPWAERIVEYGDMGGAPIELVNQSAYIDQKVAEWNAANSCGGGDTTGGPGPGEDSGPGGDGPGPWPESSGTGGSESAGFGDEPVGCGCRSGGGGLSWMLMMLGLGVGLGTRRRRLA